MKQLSDQVKKVGSVALYSKSSRKRAIRSARIGYGCGGRNLKLGVITTLICLTDKLGWAYPTEETIGNRIGCSDRHVRRLIKSLEQDHVLYVERGKETDPDIRWKNKVNRYKVDFQALEKYARSRLTTRKRNVLYISLKERDNNKYYKKGNTDHKIEGLREEKGVINSDSCAVDVIAPREGGTSPTFGRSQGILSATAGRANVPASQPWVEVMPLVAWRPNQLTRDLVGEKFGIYKPDGPTEIEGFKKHWHRKHGWHEYKREEEWNRLWYHWCKTTHQRKGRESFKYVAFVPYAVRGTDGATKYYREFEEKKIGEMGGADQARARLVEQSKQREYAPYQKQIKSAQLLRQEADRISLESGRDYDEVLMDLEDGMLEVVSHKEPVYQRVEYSGGNFIR